MAAIVNINTGKIIGAKEGSFAWWHEKGHIEYSNSEKGIKYQYYQQMFLIITIAFNVAALFVPLFKFAPLVTIILFCYYFIYEESFCNGYARRKLKEQGLTDKEIEDKINLEDKNENN